MSFLTTTRYLTVTTAIPSPSTLIPTSYIQALHNHSLLISLAPSVTSTTPIAIPSSMLNSASTSDSGSVNIQAGMDCYELVEDLPIRGKYKMVAAFHDINDGTGCLLLAPGGLRVDSWTKVMRSEGQGGDGWELREQVKLQGNWLLLPFVESNVVKARRAVHDNLIRRIENSKKAEGTGS